MGAYAYEGTELDLFSRATHWKDYWCRQLRPFVRGRVLEVGAGSGNNAFLLDVLEFTRWVSIEPDARLASQLGRTLQQHSATEVVIGTIGELPADASFDTILYLDVLEHIKDDDREMRAVARLLKPNGTLVVLAPAHQWLYTPFDKAIGHFRRYSRRTLCAAVPHELRLVSVRYLDSAGLLASLANGLLLRQAMPTASQLRLWDGYLVPVSRRLDPLLGYRLGKSILGVWQHAV